VDAPRSATIFPKTGIFKVSVPPILTYLFKNYKQFSPTEIHREFGDQVGSKTIGFLESFLGFEKTNHLLTFKDTDIDAAVSLAIELIRKHEKISGRDDFNTHLEVIEKLKNVNFKKIDKDFGLKISSGFVFTERIATRLVEAIQSHVALEIRKVREGKRDLKQQKMKAPPSAKKLAKQLLEETKTEDNGFLHFVKKPKTWNQIRRKYPKQKLSDETLWELIKNLHEKDKITIRVKQKK